MAYPRLLSLLFGLASCVLVAAQESEIVIHTGPITSTPKLGTLTPSGANVPSGEMQVSREFRVSKTDFEKLAMHSPRRPSDVWEGALPATEAIKLAKASIETGDGGVGIVIRELKLMLSPEAPGGLENRALEYYFVHASFNGSQVYRVVLMDGNVVKPTTIPVKN
ncbi:hypothetical protein [Haloferula sp.]|uniref:hypothetical protein n=1 Tax=Haloferula sp. TaxID=2497595 RepID=UPI00329BB577